MLTNRGILATQTQAAWPVLVLVLLAVLAPTACVLWFMDQAVRNEQLAVRQRLAEVYRARLIEAQAKLDDYWKGRLSALEPLGALAAPEAFAQAVLRKAADSAVIFGA